MKRWTWVALILLVTLLVAGCGGGAQATPTPTEAPAAPAPTPTKAAAMPTPATSGKPAEAGNEIDKIELKEPVEIVFWHVLTKHLEKAMLELVDEFNRTNPYGITVKPEYAGYYGDIYKKTIAAIAAGSPPDLAIAYQNMVSEYAQADAVVDLDPYIQSKKYGLSEEDLNDFFPAFLASDRYPAFGNKMLSFPFNRSVEVMYYNLDMLKEAGFDGPPATWEEFDQICEAVTKDKDGDGQPDQFCYAISPSASTFDLWLFSRGGKPLSDDGKTIAFNDEVGLEVLTWLRNLVDKGYAYQISERYGDQTDFGNEKVAFTFGSSTGISYYEKAVADPDTGEPKFAWGVTLPPQTPPNKATVGYGPSVAIFKTTPEKQLAAWLFVKWYTEKEQTLRWAQASRYMPLRKSAAEDPSMQKFFEENPVYKQAFDILQYAKNEPSIAGWQEVRGLIGDMLVAVISGEMTPQEALEYYAAEAQRVLDEKGY